MKETIRFNTFETNSSSCHSLTILTDEEYNNLKNHKAFLLDSEYFVPTLDNFEKFINDFISWKKSCINTDTEKLKQYTCLKDKGIENCSEDELKTIAWNADCYSNQDLSQRLEEQITRLKNSIKEDELYISNRKTINAHKLFDFISNNFDRIATAIDTDDWVFEELSEIEIDVIIDYFEDIYTIDNYDFDEYETFDSSRMLPNGETVHVIGYYGYNG